MRIVMLGWEFPPFIAGGLGTACHGLTKALDRAGHEILFVLPRAVDRSQASHVTLLSPDAAPMIGGGIGAGSRGLGGLGLGGGGLGAAELSGLTTGIAGDEAILGLGLGTALGGAVPFGAPLSTQGGFEHTKFLGVPASFRSPYSSAGSRKAARKTAAGARMGDAVGIDDPADMDEAELQAMFEESLAAGGDAPHGGGGGGGAMFGGNSKGPGSGYQGDLFAESERYARLVVSLTRRENFDVIHAHDWLTFPAGLALARVTGRPLIVHVHSTEFDRSGEHINQKVYDVERRGMMGALRVIAVSELTKSICVRRYGVAPSKVDVVYNGIDNAAMQPQQGEAVRSKDRIVLFLGRITMQKGPEYFIAAAKRVLEKVPNAKFFIAGSGDMEVRMIELAAALGIGHRVFFTGFLRGQDVDKIYRMADCYVMPSVSEPFGIAPLEAMRNDVPVIISKQSGVSEVLSHALKVDFWDIDEMANKIVAVLRHPPLGATLREHGSMELKKLTWDGAADVCNGVYGQAVEAQRELIGV